jgi:hypothetical protein
VLTRGRSSEMHLGRQPHQSKSWLTVNAVGKTRRIQAIFTICDSSEHATPRTTRLTGTIPRLRWSPGRVHLVNGAPQELVDRVKVLDFGLAKSQEDETLTLSNAESGLASYFAVCASRFRAPLRMAVSQRSRWSPRASTGQLALPFRHGIRPRRVDKRRKAARGRDAGAARPEHAEIQSQARKEPGEAIRPVDLFMTPVQGLAALAERYDKDSDRLLAAFHRALHDGQLEPHEAGIYSGFLVCATAAQKHLKRGYKDRDRREPQNEFSNPLRDATRCHC